MSSSVIPATTPVSWTAVPDGSAASPSFAFQNSSGTGFYRVSANVLGISTAGVQRVVVDASGNVGVGRATNLTGSANFKAIGIGATGTIMAGATTGGAYMAQNLYFDGAVWRYLINGTALLYEQAGGSHTWFYAASGTGGNSSSNIQAMTLDSSGQLTVGTSSLSSTTRHVIYGYGGSSENASLIVRSTEPSDADRPAISLYKVQNSSATTQRFMTFLINGAGSAIGSGQINANGASAAAFGSYSDRRLKENIAPLAGELEKVLALNPVEFDFKDGSGHQVGFIAQEMEEIYPDAVSVLGETEEMKMITGWDKTTARLVKAIQEQQVMIEDLKAEIEALKAK